MSDDALPFVTIAMPCYNEEAFIEACIRCVQAQDYPPSKLEILVADGMSMDATREILARLSADDPRIVVIDNPDRIQAAGLNEIVRRAKGDVVVRMDVHAEYAPNYVRACVDVLSRTGADNVGGAQRAKPTTPFQRALCAALKSPLGVGGAKYRSADEEGYVDTVFLGAFRRSVFERIGMWDRKAVTNEDAELNQRILEAGGRIYLSREIVVHYHPRDSYRSLAKQYFRYGKGRARTLLKRGTFPSIRPAIPFLMVLVEGVLLLVPSTHPIAYALLAAYGVGTAVEALRVARDLGIAGALTTWGIFPVLHVSHGVGFAAGLLRYVFLRDWDATELLTSLDGERAAYARDVDHGVAEPLGSSAR